MASHAPQRRKRRPAPVFAERVSRTLITIGGIGTIVAVTLIFFFLVAVVVPLFQDGSVERPRVVETGRVERLLGLGLDGGADQAWTLDGAGHLRVLRTSGGAPLQRLQPFEGKRITTLVSADLDDEVLFGFEDGSIAFARAEFATDFLEDEPEELSDLAIGEVRSLGDAVVERTPERQLRRTRFALQPGASVQLVDASIESMALCRHPTGTTVAALDGGGSLVVSSLRERKNLLTGKVKLSVGSRQELELASPPEDGATVLLSGSGRFVMLVEPEGTLRRWNVSDPERAELTDSVDVAPGAATVTAVRQLLGRETIAFGDSDGTVSLWFSANVFVAEEDRVASETGDPLTERDELLLARELWDAPHPISALAISVRSRLLAAGTEDGELRIFNATTGAEVVELGGLPTPRYIVLSPKETGFAFVADDGLHTYDLDPRYPEVTLSSLFGKVHYEGYASARHVWQSSSGSDDFEPKFGTWPLVFGTLKATLYSMLFGAPLAILAALFTSEFLSSRWRTPIKSTIELMASLPSVVLGFLAAMVIAPFVRDVLPATLLTFLFVPLLLLLGAYLWQLQPVARAVRLSGWPLCAIGLTLPLGVALAVAFSAPFERLFFGGDIEAWLDGQVGRAFGGWFYLLLPLAALVVAVAVGRSLTPRLAAQGWGRKTLARADLLKFFGGAGAALGLAAAASYLLDVSGADPRGGVMGTYVQRNALIVGVVMGFAIIPIIYTLAEDALSEVPGHLREASLGAGATHWQTAIRVVIPVGMSGLFSAIMIGLGRAVGETMIVLMAAGNTPLLDWNIFNGFRTLSANIAVELPEAVQGSAHYRTLFLAALVLFAMTFFLNSLAELVRRRFRRKASAL